MSGVHNLAMLVGLAPALLTGFFALVWFRAVCSQVRDVSIDLSGFLAARRLLDAAGLVDVGIQQTPGDGDHYDSRTRTVQLSGVVYHGRSVIAVGMAARVAGIAMQQAGSRVSALLHNGAAIAAAYGYGPGLILALVGVLCKLSPLTVTGVAMFNAAFLLQLVRLPIQWNACAKAKRHLDGLGLADRQHVTALVRLMNASVLTDLARTIPPLMLGHRRWE